ncbi:hypothetical protein E2C01_094832 [Portunus trituberculatus]|uniref:Uncharacterized protein n=1 Tax=Portunus trituberculatus TaxID=210409 RepID=A0A5B7JX74_PORTR|nr:hypothetical protein [Portunus trituberculatus]
MFQSKILFLSLPSTSRQQGCATKVHHFTKILASTVTETSTSTSTVTSATATSTSTETVTLVCGGAKENDLLFIHLLFIYFI